MKKNLYVINTIILIIIIVLFRSTELKTEEIKTIIDIKQLTSASIKMVETSNSENVLLPEVQEVVEEPQEEIIEASIPVPDVTTDILDTLYGKMSGYGPNCIGCSGYIASGRYVGDGNITYYDNVYGSVRILAGDSSLKFGTIVRIKNSRIGTFTGIVLDRGGSIGIGKQFMFDLLYSSESEALKDEVSYNVTFEVLRYGY